MVSCLKLASGSLAFQLRRVCSSARCGGAYHHFSYAAAGPGAKAFRVRQPPFALAALSLGSFRLPSRSEWRPSSKPGSLAATSRRIPIRLLGQTFGDCLQLGRRDGVHCESTHPSNLLQQFLTEYKLACIKSKFFQHVLTNWLNGRDSRCAWHTADDSDEAHGTGSRVPLNQRLCSCSIGQRYA